MQCRAAWFFNFYGKLKTGCTDAWERTAPVCASLVPANLTKKKLKVVLQPAGDFSQLPCVLYKLGFIWPTTGSGGNY